VYRGLALAKQGQPEAGIRQIGQALSSLEAMGSEFYRSVNLSLLAEAHTCARQVMKDRALSPGRSRPFDMTGERVREAEIWRLRGELLPMRAGPDGPQAEACFRQANEIVRRQAAQSSSYALRRA
jgi:hypothetical protein